MGDRGQPPAKEANPGTGVPLPLFEALSLPAILTTAPEGGIIGVNPAFEQAFGIPRQECVGRTSIELGIHGDPSIRAAAFSELNEHGALRGFEVTLTTRNSGERTFSFDSALMEVAGRRCAIYIGLDITDRKQMEEALRESEVRYRTLFETSRDAIMTLAPPSWRFTGGNRAAIEMFGARDEADLVSRGPWEYSPATQPDGRASDEKARAMIDAAMEKGSHIFEWTHERLGGEPFPATVLLTRVELAGQAVLQATVRDVTAKKHAEAERVALMEQLAEAKKMDAIGNLAGGVAHDFNNLMSVILSYSGLALEGLPEGDATREDVTEIRKAAERAAALTRQLLAFGRRQVLKPAPLDLNEVVRGLQKMLGRIIGEDVELVVALAPAVGRVLADQGQIEQVIMNLVANARDAMPGGGTLTISTSDVEGAREESARGPYARLAVTDTGAGMVAETRARCFEPFYTTKEKGKGTGLGLSTVYGIVRQSGGYVFVDSAPGRGTTFEIYLPRSMQVGPARVSMAPAATACRGNETILVVEDEATLRVLARRILERAGYNVLTAACGGDAIRICEQHDGPIDLVLTDVIMPHMSGKALVDRVAQVRPATRTLYMSGYPGEALLSAGELGDRFLGKPFTTSDLTKKVREVLDA